MQETGLKRAPGRPSAEESEDIHRRILEAATREFITAGYEDCSMSRVAKAAGSTKPTIYRLYPSKEALFKTIIERAIQEYAGAQPELVGDTRPLRVILKEVAGRIQKSAKSSMPGLWIAVTAVREKFPEVYRSATEIVAQKSIATKLTALFEDLNARGVMTIERPLLAANNFALIVGSAPRILNTTSTSYSDEEVIDQAINLYLAAYAPIKAQAEA